MTDDPPSGSHYRHVAVVAVPIALAAILVGCSSSRDRAAPVGDCVDPGCVMSGSGGAAGSGGGRGNATGGAAADAGGGAAAGAGGGAVAGSGRMRIYVDTSFTTTREFTGAGVVGVTGSRRATGTFEAGHWSVSGADTSGTPWADLHATVMAADALDTLEVLDGPSADLVLAPRSAFDVIVSSLASVQSLNPTFAQIVLKFVNAANQPIAGLVLVTSQAVTVAYDAGDSYTDTKGAPFGATQARGMAIIMNQTAPSFPGAPITIEYVAPNTSTTTPVELRAAMGAVTFKTVVVN